MISGPIYFSTHNGPNTIPKQHPTSTSVGEPKPEQLKTESAVFVRQRETERDRERQRETQRDRERQKETERETERQRDRETERQRDRDTERQRDKEVMVV